MHAQEQRGRRDLAQRGDHRPPQERRRDRGQLSGAGDRDPDNDQPQRRERQAVQKPHQCRAERAEVAGQMPLRRIAQRLRQRRADRDRYPGPGTSATYLGCVSGFPTTAGASGSYGAASDCNSASVNPIAARNASRTSCRLAGLEDVALQVAAAERVAQELLAREALDEALALGDRQRDRAVDFGVAEDRLRVPAVLRSLRDRRGSGGGS